MKIKLKTYSPLGSVATYKFELENGKSIEFSDIAYECSDGSAILEFIEFLKSSGEDIELIKSDL